MIPISHKSFSEEPKRPCSIVPCLSFLTKSQRKISQDLLNFEIVNFVLVNPNKRSSFHQTKA